MKATSEVERLEEKIKELEGKVSSLEAGNKMLRDSFKEPEFANYHVSISRMEAANDHRQDPIVTVGGKSLKDLLNVFSKCSEKNGTFEFFELEYDEMEVDYSSICSVYAHLCLKISKSYLRVETKHRGVFYFDADSESFLSRDKCEFNAEAFVNDFYPRVETAKGIYIQWLSIVEDYLEAWYEEDVSEENIDEIAMRLSMQGEEPVYDSRCLYPTVVEVLENNR